MKKNKDVQKIIEIINNEGYQIDREGVEYLKTITYSKNMIKHLNRKLKQINNLPEKPLFLSKEILEEGEEKQIKKYKKQNLLLKRNNQKPIIKKTKLRERSDIYAKNIEKNIRIIDNPGQNIKSDGTLKDYLNYFQDRFCRLTKILRKRIDVKSATTIEEALKAQPKTTLKIIGIITEKKDNKKSTWLTIEDLTTKIKALIPNNSSQVLLNKVQTLLLDQVICLDVVKTRNKILLVKDIILPDIPYKPKNRASIPIYAVLTSDLHIGSSKFQKKEFNRFVLWLEGKYGDEELKEMSKKIKYVLIAGDIVDGIGVYPNQIKELDIKGIYEQYDCFRKYVERIPEHIEIILIPGNHDISRKALPQPPIPNEMVNLINDSRKIISLGNPCYITIHGVEILIQHGRSLDDITSNISGIDYKKPEKAMNILLQSRHLAPVYGGKTLLAPERRDPLIIDRVPDIFHSGHTHIFGYNNYRGVSVINSGCWQEQTDFMRTFGLTPTPGITPLINLKTFEIKWLSFN